MINAYEFYNTWGYLMLLVLFCLGVSSALACGLLNVLDPSIWWNS